MSKAERMFKIYKILEEESNTGFYIKGSELAKKVNSDNHTVSKDVSSLKEAGINVDTAKGPDGGYRLPGMYLGSREEYALTEAFKFLTENNFALLDDFKMALDKINYRFGKNIK